MIVEGVEMNYENMIDLDINANVTALEHECGDWEFNGVEFYHCGIDGSGYHSVPVKDYCNNPSEAWPIIINNNITVTPCMGKNSGGATAYSEHEKHIEVEFVDNSKALRAAMIVYLEMNKDKK